MQNVNYSYKKYTFVFRRCARKAALTSSEVTLEMILQNPDSDVTWSIQYPCLSKLKKA